MPNSPPYRLVIVGRKITKKQLEGDHKLIYIQTVDYMSLPWYRSGAAIMFNKDSNAFHLGMCVDVTVAEAIVNFHNETIKEEKEPALPAPVMTPDEWAIVNDIKGAAHYNRSGNLQALVNLIEKYLQ